MTPGRRRASVMIAAIVMVSAAALGFALLTPRPAPIHSRDVPPRPTLLLLTSLPLVFGERFSLSDAGSPTLTALRSRYRVVPISVSSPEELSRGRLLLMAQPRAQSPQNLVALDAWVRKGGRLLLLADPALEWPSALPLGDPQRPPPMFADTGLLAHWGLRLDAPDERGPAPRTLSGYQIMAASPGVLVGRCRLDANAFVADCRIGHGRATVVADADFLNVAPSAAEGRASLNGLLSQLARLAAG